MNKILLTESQANYLDSLISRHQSAYDFWRNLLGDARHGKLWIVERINRFEFTVIKIGPKLRNHAILIGDVS